MGVELNNGSGIVEMMGLFNFETVAKERVFERKCWWGREREKE